MQVAILSERMLSLEQRLEVVLLRVDRERAKIALGLGRKVPDPTWRTPAVVGIARSVAEERRWEWLPVLADALEEAGCGDADLLGQLRAPGLQVSAGRLIDYLLSQS